MKALRSIAEGFFYKQYFGRLGRVDYFHTMKLLRRVCFFLFLAATILCGDSLRAQDLIVTIQGDSLNVKIQKETDQFLYYRTVKSKKGDFVISRKEVSDFKFNFFLAEGEQGHTTQPDEEPKSVFTQKRDRFQLWGNGGGAYYLAFTDQEDEAIKDYYNKLRWGYSFGLGANFFFTNRFGVGASFEQSAFSNTFDGTVGVTFTLPSGMDTLLIGSLSDDITLRHIGVNFLMRFPFERTGSAIQLSFGLGYNTFENKASVVKGFEYEGNSIGLSINGEYQIALGGGLFLPIKLGLTNVSFVNMKVTTSPDMPPELAEFITREFENDEENPQSGSRIALTLGLLYAF